jgi:CHAT domain-containing protein
LLGLGEIPADCVTGPATLGRLIDRLQEGPDILHLVCHGALVGGEPWLWLEDAQGKSDKVSGTDLAARLRELQRRPLLVVLCSCQSAGGADDWTVHAALGPRLVVAGVAAVVAVRGDFSMATAARFFPHFYRELRRDCRIDRALASARGAVRDRPDHWMPVLFLRLVSGRVARPPGPAGEGGSGPTSGRP